MCCKREENWLKSVTGIHVIEGKLQWVFKSRIFIFKTSNFLVQSITVNFIPPPQKKTIFGYFRTAISLSGPNSAKYESLEAASPFEYFFSRIANACG